MNETNDRRDREFAERAGRLFADSVAGLDAQTRSRLTMARARALESAGRRRSVWLSPARVAPVGAVAAAVLALAVFWPAPDVVQPVETTVLNDLDLLLEGEELELFEDLEFYAWLLEQPEMQEVAADGDGSG
jgi:hypothetical protein